MITMRDAFRTLLLLVVLIGCERSKVAPPPDSTRQVTGITPQTPAPTSTSTWDAAIGPVLLVGGDVPEIASLLSPDESADTSGKISGLQVKLLGRGGELQSASLLHPTSATEGGCVGLALWTLASKEPVIAAWSLGVAANEQVRPVAMDSVES